MYLLILIMFSLICLVTNRSIDQLDLNNSGVKNKKWKLNDIYYQENGITRKAISDNEIIPQQPRLEKRITTPTTLIKKDKLLTTKSYKLLNKCQVIEMLLEGKSDELINNRAAIKRLFWLIDKIELSLKQKHVLWDIIKGNKTAKDLKLNDLRLSRKILPSISEYDLVNLNLTDWTIVSYLGRIKDFTPRQMSLLAHTLTTNWGKEILKNSTQINKLFGIICGFQEAEIIAIPPEIFLQIQSPTFNYLYACNNHQLKILLNLALKPDAYGPIQIWSATNLINLGMIIKELNSDQIESIRAEAMKGIDRAIIEQLSDIQLKAMSSEQFNNLNYLSKTSFRLKTGLVSSSTCCLKTCLITEILVIFQTYLSLIY